MTSPYEQHSRSAAPIAARCAVITLSDTRTAETDKSGRRMRELLEVDGHAVARYEILPDEPKRLASELEQLLSGLEVDCILTNGGTGISRRDKTIEVIEKAFDRPLPGFGELFRMLSWAQIGSGAMLSRAAGGVARGKPLFAMPGSTAAVELAMTKLILPELRHLLLELRK
jgi:molybdenum cofactor biosynthesis protein B